MDGVFAAADLIPTHRPDVDSIVGRGVHWNYTTVLNIVFLAVAALLVWRYFRRGGGVAMLRMMNRPMPRAAS